MLRIHKACLLFFHVAPSWRHRLLYGACCFGKPTVSALNFVMNYVLLEIDEFCMLELRGATHRKNGTNGHYDPGRPPTLGHGGCPKQPFCAILFYVLPRVTESCKTCLYGSIEVKVKVHFCKVRMGTRQTDISKQSFSQDSTKKTLSMSSQFDSFSNDIL